MGSGKSLITNNALHCVEEILESSGKSPMTNNALHCAEEILESSPSPSIPNIPCD